jgi:hypothetical protein
MVMVNKVKEGSSLPQLDMRMTTENSSAVAIISSSRPSDVANSDITISISLVEGVISCQERG